MDLELIKLDAAANSEELKKYVEGLDFSRISSEIPQLILRNDAEGVIHRLLSNLGTSTSAQQKKFVVTELIVREMEKQDMPARLGEKLMAVLASQVDSLPTAQLLRLVDVCLDLIRRPPLRDSSFACWKELLPRLMQLIVEKGDVEDGGTQMSGEKYKNTVVSTICLSDWPDSLVVDLAAMFVDMPLSKEERSRVVRKLCSVVSSVKEDTLPPLTHHLLRLTRNEYSIPLLLVLSQYFNDNLYSKMDVGTTEAAFNKLWDVEGTVVYHVVQSNVSVDPFRQCLHCPEEILQPFLVTLLLAVSGVSPSSEESAVSILRAAFVRSFVEKQRLLECAWLQSVSPSALDHSRLMTSMLDSCYRGRHSVVKGLMSLGFTLLACGRGGSDDVRALGLDILEDLVKRHRLMTTSVLQKLGDIIFQTQDPSHYTECLVLLSRRQPLKMAECSSLLLQLLEKISTQVPPRIISQFLSALLPLSRLSHPLRDNLVIVLRKSLFPFDVERRIMAVKGFLELLKDLKISNLHNLSQSMSQNYCNMTQLCSQSLTGGAAQSNEGLCLEVLSILREVFKQQHQVKTVLYRGIYLAVRANCVLGPHVLDHVQTQLEKFVVSGTSLPPLTFNSLVVIKGAEVVLMEPLGELILCVGLLAAKLEDSTRSAKLQEIMTSLCLRLVQCDVSTFQLNQDDFGEIESMKTQMVIEQILGVYEALIGYVLCSWKRGTGDQAEQLLSLFRGFTCLSDYARGLGKVDRKKSDGKNKQGKPPIFKMPPTLLNLKMPVAWAAASTITALRGKRELHRYALQTAGTIVQQLTSVSPLELSRDCSVIGYLCKIGRTVYSKCISCLSEVKGFDLRCAMLGVQLFSDLLTLVFTHFKTKLEPFLTEIAGVVSGSPLQTVIETLLNQIDDVLSEEETEEEAKEDLQATKMSTVFLSVLGSLAAQLPRDTHYTKQVYEKLKDICEKTVLEKPGVAKSLLTLLLQLHRHSQESTPLLQDLALCLCNSMQLIDDEMEVEEHKKYKVINSRTGKECLLALCQHIQLMLNDVEFIVHRFKAEIVILAHPTQEPMQTRKDRLRDREIRVCHYIEECTRVVSAFCNIAVPPGVYSDAVLKSLELIYNRLTQLTKYFTVKVSKFDENIANTRFDRTVRMVDSELTKYMYCFTEHVIADRPKDGKGVKPAVEKQRALKQTKLIPKVVLEKEQFHKFLLQLSKRAKVDLAAKTKHAMARDYRLYARQVRDLLEKENAEPTSDDMETEDIEEGDTSVDSPTSKRSRMSRSPN